MTSFLFPKHVKPILYPRHLEEEEGDLDEIKR